MKKTLIMAGLLAVMLTSCKNKSEPGNPSPTPTPPPVEDPAPPKAPEPRTKTTTTTTTTKTVEEKDGTSVNISDRGLNIESKDGNDKSNVTISRKEKSVEIKRD